MTSSETMAPWQIGALTPLGRVVIGSLIFLIADSLLLRSSTPYVAAWTLFGVAPVWIAVRVVRGFPGWPPLAASFLALALGLAVLLAAQRSAPDPALISAAVVSAAGLVASAGAWFERRIGWPPVTVATLTSGAWPVPPVEEAAGQGMG